MCGRYQLSIQEKDISIRFHVEVYEKLYRPSYNCAPSQTLAVITNEKPEQLSFFRWGLVPFWAKDLKTGYKLINARAESVTEKSSFRGAFKNRRCLVPANGFFEWKRLGKVKIPHRIFLKEENIFSMAGLWELWNSPEGDATYSFTIITTRPNSLMGEIHDRMPVILKKEDETRWLDTDTTQDSLLEMMKPFEANKMAAYPVSDSVNSPGNNNPDIILPAGPIL